MQLFLIGYMGCGKSTIGKKLSSRHGCRLIDTDGEIERREGCSVSDIFARSGEEYFRHAERALLEEILASGEDCIVSTGGGLPMWGDNMELMSQSATTIYLRRTAENIASRLSPAGRERRPKLRGLSDEELVVFMRENIAQREDIYRRATVVVEANTLSDVAIMELIDSYL